MSSTHYTPEQEADWAGEFARSDIKTGVHSGKGRRCIFDVEGDGLLYATYKIVNGREVVSKGQVTQVWCVAAVDIDTGEEFYWGVDQSPEPSARGTLFVNLAHGLHFLAECELLIGHHAIGYDYPALERLYPWFKRPAQAWDSLVVAKAVYPYDALIGPDMELIKRGKLPAQMMKRHSLAAWGYRTGTRKGEYEGGFDAWCPAMAVYLMGDIRGTLALWKLLEKRLGWRDNEPDPKTGKRPRIVWPEAVIETECKVARIIHEQWEAGVHFDMAKAVALSAELSNTKTAIERKLVEAFGSWWEPSDEQVVAKTHYTKALDRHGKPLPDITVPRVSEKTGKPLKPYVGPPLCEWSEGSRFVHIKRVEYAPNNRHHLGKRLMEVYGWKPKKYGSNGAPTVDESTLEEIPEAVLPAGMRRLILDSFVVNKTYAMLTSGARAWITMASKGVHPDAVYKMGRIHGEMDTSGAVTRRGTHKNPNLSQVPGVRKEKRSDGKEHTILGLAGRYGWECRELFRGDMGWEQTGVDASSLELIDLGHYLYPLDNGAFTARVCDPTRDAHREHAVLCGMVRADAKTAIYLKVYGGSAYKLSLDLSVSPEEIPTYITSKSLPGLLRGLERRFDADFVRKLDDKQKAKIAKAQEIIKKLEKGIAGLKDLITSVQGAAERGWLKAIDGSTIIVRKPHAALNSLLQSAGAISCKLWMVLVHEELERRGYRRGRDWLQVLWVHDELQFTHRPGLGPIIKEVAEECMVKTGEQLGLRGRYRTDGKTGLNWAECH